jgi:CHAT domain-containing protein
LACLELAERGIDADSHRTRALSYTDRARSLALDPLLRGDEVAGSPAAGRWREAAASWAADVDRLLAAIDADPPADTGAVLAAVDASEERLRALEVDLDDADPGTLVRRAHPRAPAQFGSLVAEFAPGTALLEFHTVGDDLVVAAVTGGGIEIARRPVRTRRLAALARRYHARCVEGRGAGPEADELASLLLEPVAEVLRAHHRLVVVPFGPLYSVPVHALAFDGEPLGRTRTVSYAPSAALGIPTDQPIPRGSAAVVGDPAFDPALHPRLRRLPGAEIEARAVAARLGCTEPLIGEAADEATVRRLLPDRAVLHLATHGWLNELGPYASSLVLAGRDSLVVSELVGMRLSARLAVLSACDTGRGAATLGGDVIGLTRALLAAGVRQTVVSLWPVDDRTACLTMAAFHDALGRGDPPAAALTHAQGVVHDLDAAGMRDAYATLCREVGSTSARLDAGDRRRGELDDELADNEPLPEPLGGSAERHWAPFILIDASQPRMGQTRMRQT